MKKRLPFLISLSLCGFSTSPHAENLIQVYQQTRDSNPDLRKAVADRDAALEKINELRSPLLPQLGLGADTTYVNGMRDNSGQRSTNYSASLQLTQTLFDMSTWRRLTLTEKQAAIQGISYQATEQTLILNTATAYFNVLRTIDAWFYTEANKQAIYRQLEQTTQRFNVGLVAITDVQNARAQYDQVLANEVFARNNLENSLETLRQLTGRYYLQLNALDIARFVTRSLEKVDTLIKTAEQKNLSLLSARLNQDLAREQIKFSQTGYLPTLNLTASSGLSTTNYHSLSRSQQVTNPTGASSHQGQNSIALNVNLPLYSGGATNSQVKQAQYNFVGASESLESTHRNVVQNVRSSFNNISAAISSIAAYQQATISAQSSLEATEAGYTVGTRTIVDVLNATTTLYNAKQNLSNARYDYLIGHLNIKYALGTLDLNDLQALNAELSTPTGTSPGSQSFEESRADGSLSPIDYRVSPSHAQ